MKITRFIANLTTVGPPIKAESTYSFWVIFVVFWRIWATFVAREQVCDLETSS